MASANVKSRCSCRRYVARGIFAGRACPAGADDSPPRVRSNAAASVSKRASARHFSSGTGSLRRQFGCASVVAGRFICSRTPTTSSSCTTISCDGVRARKTWIARASSSVIVGIDTGSTPRPFGNKPSRSSARNSRARSCARASNCSARVSSDGSSPRLARSAISCPSHQPRSVGRSCVLAVTIACFGYSAGRLNSPAGSRSNKSTRYESTPATSSEPRKSSGTVPRSSPITMQRWARLSSARMPSKSSIG